MKIRMKHDHRRIADALDLRQILRVEHHPYGRWVSNDPVSGTTTHYNEDVWEEVPTERWETITPVLYQHGRLMRILYQSRVVPHHCIDHTLPEGLRFVQDGDSVRIEGRIA